MMNETSSFARLAKSRSHGLLVAGGVLLSAWLGGNLALYGAYRNSDTPHRAASASVTAAAPAARLG